jgi:hypothetical protein
MAHINAGRHGLIGAPSYPMLRDVTQVAFWEILELENIPYRFFKQENRLYLTEPRSNVLFRSLDSPERLRGTNLAWFGIDELTFCKEDSFLRLEARLRDPQAKLREAFAVWTPNGYDWVYKRFIDSPATGYSATLASPRENFHVLEMYDRLEQSYDERFYRQEVLGEYLNIRSGAVYYAFSREHNLRKLDYDPMHPLCWSLDFNVNPMCSVIGQVIEHQPYRHLGVESSKHIRILDEICLPESNINAACAEFVRRTEKYLSYGRTLPVWIYGDPAGNNRNHAGDSDWGLVERFFKNDYRYELRMAVASSHNLVRDRVNAVNAALCNALGEHRLTIDPGCTELVADLEQVVWKLDSHGNSIFEIDKRDPKRTHVSDGLGYMVEQVLPIQRGEVGFGQTRLV